MTRPVLVPRHVHRTPRIRRPRLWSLPIAALVVSLVAAVAPAASGPVPLGPVSTVAMSSGQLADRAEYDDYYARKLGHRMTRNFGYTAVDQWHCLRSLWRLESSWRVHADNRYSSAYGIPQANPGSKMSTAGDHWKRDAQTQIRWGLRYIHGRYGKPCVALHHKHRTGWY